MIHPDRLPIPIAAREHRPEPIPGWFRAKDAYRDSILKYIDFMDNPPCIGDLVKIDDGQLFKGERYQSPHISDQVTAPLRESKDNLHICLQPKSQNGVGIDTYVFSPTYRGYAWDIHATAYEPLKYLSQEQREILLLQAASALRTQIVMEGEAGQQYDARRYRKWNTFNIDELIAAIHDKETLDYIQVNNISDPEKHGGGPRESARWLAS